MQFRILRKPIAAILIVSTSLISIGNFDPPASAQVQAVAAVAAGVATVANVVINQVRGLIGEDNKKREDFTQQTIAQLNQKYPDYNAVISHNGGTDAILLNEKLQNQLTQMQRQLDELRQMGPVASADLETIRDRILAGLKLGKQAPAYKSARLALDKLLQELTETNGRQK